MTQTNVLIPPPNLISQLEQPPAHQIYYIREEITRRIHVGVFLGYFFINIDGVEVVKEYLVK
jgi:hypothetical protein